MEMGCTTGMPHNVQRGMSKYAFLGICALLFVMAASATVVWCVSMSSTRGMSMTWIPMPGHTWFGTAAGFLAMWIVMMVAMMLPSLTPALWRYRQAVALLGTTRPGHVTAFAGIGYFLVWAVIGLFVFLIGTAWATVDSRQLLPAHTRPLATGMLVLLAGVFQFTTWKARRLARCREMSKRHDMSPIGAGAAWKYGVRLGLHCSECCAGLMAISLAIGIMDLRAMATVTAAITLERIVPAATHTARGIGVIAVAAGILIILQATLLA